MPKTIRDPAAVDRIVDAATTVVAAQGIDAASVRSIAAEAGVSTGFITHYFDDKHSLMVAVLAETNARAARRLQRATRTGDGLDRLRAAIDSILPFDTSRRRDWQVWVAVWSHASPGDDLAAGYRSGWSGLREMLARLLDDACADGGLPTPIDVSYQAERLVTMLAGVGLLAGVERPARVRALATRMFEDELTRLRQTA
jgi:AcrR family transcriptional regulator